MNVGDLIDELSRFDKNLPVRLVVTKPPEFVHCDECMDEIRVGDHELVVEHVDEFEVKRGLVGDHRLVVIIE
jgi:hypothetical protein